MARCGTVDDEVVVHGCDLDICRDTQDNIFNFTLHREPQAYGRITQTKGKVAASGKKP